MENRGLGTSRYPPARPHIEYIQRTAVRSETVRSLTALYLVHTAALHHRTTTRRDCGPWPVFAESAMAAYHREKSDAQVDGISDRPASLSNQVWSGFWRLRFPAHRNTMSRWASVTA